MTDQQPTSKPARVRRIVIDGHPIAVLRGYGHSRWSDPYHFLLTIPWWAFLTLTACAFFAGNAVFAVLFLLEPQSITNAGENSFWDAFFFSVQTLGTVGYGVMAPRTRYAETIASIESFSGLLGLALVTGLIFARFARPTARVMFSRYAVVTAFDGIPCLMFRAANQRGNQILEADVSLTLLRNAYTPEGQFIRRLEEMRVTRSRSPMFALTWTVIHPIDENSPLRGLGSRDLIDSAAQFVVVIGGTDQTFAQRIYARHAYSAEDVRWGNRLANILTFTGGERVVDYGRFHEVEPDRPAEEAGAHRPERAQGAPETAGS